MKRILTFLVLLFSFTLARAQVNAYSFSTSTGEALATGSFTNLLGTYLDDDVSALANIGFTFNYNNVNYTNFSVTSNGLLALGLGAVTDYNNVIANLSGPYIFPYWDDNYTDANGNVQYLVTGAVGSRKLVIEYNLSFLGNTGVADKKFQIWLFETSNIVQFVYGAGNDLNGGFSVGILSGSTDFHSVSVSSHTTSTVTTNDNNTTWPGSGRTYIFNPTPTVTPLSSAQSQTNVSCFGGSNGSATVTPSGGTLPYTYNWTPGNPAGDGTGSVSGLTAGTWTCTVTDAASLTIDVPVTVTQPTAISVTSASQSNVSCFGGSNGAASINVPTGGEGGYTYNWTPGNPTGDGTTSVTGLTAGTWTCTVTDINACNASVSFTLTEPTALIASSSATSISCFGGTSTVTVSATGGTTAYSGTGNFTVSAGTHTYNVSDMNGCTSNTTITVIQPEVVNAPIGNTSQTFCSALNATLASIQVTGTDIQWYDSNTGGQILATSTPLVTGTTYYATQTLGGCESPSYLAVTITLTVASAYYADLDGDGYGAGAATNACTQPVGYVLDNTDCDDNSSSVNPGATEVCNSIDDDCDSQIDDGLLFTSYYLDSDGDGYGTSASANSTLLLSENFDSYSSTITSGWSSNNLSNPIGSLSYFQGNSNDFASYSGPANSYLAVNYNSGAGTAVISSWFISPEVNLVNGGQFSFWTRTVSGTMVYPDRLQLRLSTSGASLNVGASSTSTGDFSTLLLDVNPTYTTTGYPTTWTQYTITLSGLSEPVTGRFAFRYFVEDGGPLGANSNYIGIDDVNYSVPANIITTCNGTPTGYVTTNTDCNDYSSSVNPGVTEVCNSIDDDCDTQIDEGVQNNYYADLDGDGYGAGAATNACTQPVGYVLDNTDCDDNSSSVNPGATEVCNSIDDDCDSQIDEGVQNNYYADTDGDGYGAGTATNSCTSPGAGFVTNNGDCNNTNAAIYPLATEICNNIDDDCDGSVDENFVHPQVTVSFSPITCVGGTTEVTVAATGGTQPYTGTGVFTETAGTYTYLVTDANGCTGNVVSTFNNLNDWMSLANVQSTVSSEDFNYIQDYVDLGTSLSHTVGGVTWTAVTQGGNSNTLFSGYGDLSTNDALSDLLITFSVPLNGVGGNFYNSNFSGYFTPGLVEVFLSNGVVLTQSVSNITDWLGFYSNTSAITSILVHSLPDDPTLYWPSIDNLQMAYGATLNQMTITIPDGTTPQSAYYADVDSDGYGAGIATIACSAPTGFVTTNTDCNDNSSAVNPGASEICNLIDDNCDGTADDGIPVINYYSDLDGDTFGSTLITSTCASLTGNFVVVGGDCDDSNTAINPSAVEICLNAIDDDCDGVVNDGCLPDQLFGESPATAAYAWTTFHPSCVTSTHTLAGFSPSLSAQTVCLTGEDKWHYFTATSEAVSIQVASSANDILLELQNASGTLIATENAVSGLGGEILNYSGLVSGQVYKVGVRNYNSALGIGSYTLCVKMLKRGGCDYGPGPYSLCQYFKASYGGTGTTYTFTFTGISGNASGNVYTRTQTSDICVLSNVTPSLPYGSTYNVLITSTYTLLDGAGNSEVIAVPGLSPCTMSTVSQPATSLRTADQCVNGTRFRGSVVASLPWVCGVNNWRWEFTEVNPLTYATVGLPIAVNRGAASNYINLGTVAALQNGKTYAVRTAPILPNTGSNYQWGSTYYMCIIGSAGMVVENNGSPAADTKSDIANEANMSLYPNPTHGTDVNINLSGITSENVQIRIVDAMGKQVWSNRYTVNGVLNTNITFEQPLANGLYFVEAIFNGEVQTQRMMVQK